METLAGHIDGSTLNVWVISVWWLWPLLEIVHFLGLSLLLGSMLVVDLRLAGWFRGIALTAVHQLLPLAALGFAMNLVSGLLFFCGDPFRYAVNIGFQIKMALLALAGLNALWFLVSIRPAIEGWPENADPPTLAKTIAYLSLVLWFGVMLCGRLIPYVGEG